MEIHCGSYNGQNLFNVRHDAMVVYNDDGSIDVASSIANLKAYMIENGMQIAYATADVQSTESIVCPTEYIAYNGGREALLENESDVCRTPCTVTQRYYVQNGG